MSDISIGKILIQDINQNDLFDSGIDNILDASGQSLSPAQAAAELQYITQELGVSGMGGIFLSEAAVLINGFQGASDAAQNGDVTLVEAGLKNAERAARNLGLAFDQTRADGILESGLRTGMLVKFQEADTLAQSGQSIEGIKSLLQEAAAHHQRLQSQFNFPTPFDRKWSDQILKDGFQNGIPALEKEAQNKSILGDFLGTLADLQDLKRLIPEGNLQFGFNFRFDNGKAQQAIKDAHVNGSPRIYQSIRNAALRGQTQVVRTRLRHLEGQIQAANTEFHAGLKFDQKTADRILEDALVNGISDNFRLAKNSANAGYPRAAQKWLDLARSYVDEFNNKFANPAQGKPKLVFDLKQANLVMVCAHRKGLCP